MGREPQLAGQTVVVVGGTCGVGLEIARRARADGADVIITARDPDALHEIGLQLRASIAAVDATDIDRLGGFFDELATVNHIVVTDPGLSSAAPAAHDIAQVARRAARTMRAGGTLLFVGAISRRAPPELVLELAPVRLNLIPVGAGDPTGLAIRLMTSTAATGATVDVRGE